jgi:hypothetical protein
MKSLSLFLRAAAQQFSVLTQRIMSALHVKRTAQLAAVLLLSLCVTAFITHALRTAATQKNKWTSDREVLVVTTPLDEGDEFTSQNTRRLTLPLAITPDDALDTFVAGDTARVALQPNTPLTPALVSSAQDTVKVPDGWRIVALPADMPSPPLQLRDSVDVVAGQAVIAPGVLVVSLQPLTIAVPADVAASVASVAQLGEASLISAR